jgi:hypothetical protein
VKRSPTAREPLRRSLPSDVMGTFAPIPNWLLRRWEVSHGAKLAYGRLRQYAGRSGSAYPTIRSLAVELGVSYARAKAYLGELRDHGLIRVGLRREKGRSSTYTFPGHAWQWERATPPTPAQIRATPLSEGGAPDARHGSPGRKLWLAEKQPVPQCKADPAEEIPLRDPKKEQEREAGREPSQSEDRPASGLADLARTSSEVERRQARELLRELRGQSPEVSERVVAQLAKHLSAEEIAAALQAPPPFEAGS